VSDLIQPLNTVTFTITGTPSRKSQMLTIQRLMRMQDDVQRGLRHRARRRAQHDNVATIRAGRKWIRRVRVPRVVHVRPGETFTLMLTPQILPDVKSVEKYLSAAKA
jgi:hypothetical protein